MQQRYHMINDLLIKNKRKNRASPIKVFSKGSKPATTALEGRNNKKGRTTDCRLNQLRIHISNQNGSTPKMVLGDKMLMYIVQTKPQSTHDLKELKKIDVF